MDFLKLRKRRMTMTDPAGDIRESRFVVMDTELTGLNEKKDSIVSIGAVRMLGGRIELGDAFCRLVNPENGMTAESVVFHEIMPSEVSEKPDIKAVLSEFLEYCGSDILVGFCVSIDMEFLSREAMRLFRIPIGNLVIDIFPLYEWYRESISQKNAATIGKNYSLPQRYRLYDMARHFDIPVSASHNAMIDAFVTAQIFQRIIPLLTEVGVRSVGDLVKLSDRLKGGDRHKISRGISNF